MNTERIWECKIGGVASELPQGADSPMREAVAEAFREVTGYEPQFIFSGWGAKLDEVQRAVHENRAPSAEHYSQWKLQQAAPALLEALRPFATFACDEPCECNNCKARAAIAKATA